MIAIIDLDLGNLYSISSALKYFNADYIITNNVEKIEKSDKLILSGVGSYKTGMQQIDNKNIINTIREFSDNGKSILGICLGMQLLMEYSEENGGVEGMGLIPGSVKYLNNNSIFKSSYKVPHIGWEKLKSEGMIWSDTLLDGINKLGEFYFVHSLYVETDSMNQLATSNYGDVDFCSVVKKDNIYGCQFHPEKSGDIGLEVINNFINMGEINK